jgi:phage-related baseplate assembly protein
MAKTPYKYEYRYRGDDDKEHKMQFLNKNEVLTTLKNEPKSRLVIARIDYGDAGRYKMIAIVKERKFGPNDKDVTDTIISVNKKSHVSPTTMQALKMKHLIRRIPKKIDEFELTEEGENAIK